MKFEDFMSRIKHFLNIPKTYVFFLTVFRFVILTKNL